MPWRDFDELCAFWFDCLFAVESALTVTQKGYQARAPAFLSERIFDLHLRRLQDSGRPLIDYPIFCLTDSAFAAVA